MTLIYLQAVDRNESSNMKYEQNRLKTFHDWPCTFMDPKKLASAGFYYFHVRDIVRCAFCNIDIGKWEEGDSAIDDHYRWSRNCPFLCDGEKVGNIPLNLNTNQIDLNYYGIEITKTEQVKMLNDICELGIIKVKDPIHPRYNTKTKRLSSFKNWPKSMELKIDELSDAGFFYTNVGDQTICFYCGGGLKDWNMTDDPWKEHAKWFSKCSFVLMVKGITFINEVINHTLTDDKKYDNSIMNTEQVPVSDMNKKNVKYLNDFQLCKICYAEELGIVFLPCGHLVVCVKCSSSFSNCVICRKNILACVKTIIS